MASPPAAQGGHNPAPQQAQQAQQPQQQHPPPPGEDEGPPRERPKLTLAPRGTGGAPGEEAAGDTPVTAEAAPVRKKARLHLRVSNPLFGRQIRTLRCYTAELCHPRYPSPV